MTSEKQINANRENALLGGVKTEEGKKKSRMNAVKHGFFSHLVKDSDKIEYEDFCNEIYDYFSPDNIYEEQLVEIILSNLLAYRRVCIKESELFHNAINDPQPDFFPRNISYEEKFKKDLMEELIKFQRYKISAFNLITRTKHELEKA